MSATIIDGKQIAADMREELKQRVAGLKEKGVVPGLGVILVGDDPASRSYVTAKERACEQIGIYSDDNRLPAETGQEELLALVEKMNADPKIHGILVQLPLPRHCNETEVLLAISPEKDVDGSMASVGEDDRKAVSRMFRFVFDIVEKLTPDFQVVITEHADLSEEWYQRAVVERWRGTLKLVPEDWPRNEHGSQIRDA